MLARVVWITVALVALVIFVLSIPAYFGVLQTICTDTAAYCATSTNQLSAAEVHRLVSQHLSLATYATSVLALDLANSLVFMAVGGLIFWRRSDERAALFVSLVLMTYGALGLSDNAHSSALLLVSPTGSPVPLLVHLLQSIFWPAFGAFFYLFPTGRFVPRWSWIFAIAWLIQLVVWAVPVDSPLSIRNLPAVFYVVMLLSTYGSAVGCQIYRYMRASSPAQREQTKWLVFGFATSCLVLILGSTISTVAFPQEANTPDATYLLIGVVIGYVWLLPIPLSIGIAVLRYRLWDIDAIINKALVYGLLTALLGVLYVGLILGLENLVGVFTRQTNQPVVLVVSTLAIAALFLPVRRWIQALIDRRFYRSKYDAVKTLAAFSAVLRQEVDLGTLQEQLFAAVEETMQPAHVSEWRRQRAWELSQQGWWQKDIAAALGVSCAAVCQWLKRAREQGVEALRPQPRPRWAGQADVRAARADPGVVGPRGRGLRLPGRCLDGQPHRGGDLAHVRRALPSRPCQPLAAPRRLESPAAHRAGDPTRRGGHSAVVRRALARFQKN